MSRTIELLFSFIVELNRDVMNKKLKKGLIILASLFGVVLLLALSGWLYLKSQFLSFEDDIDQVSIEEITISGYSFLDRNNNDKLDIYEDDRRSIADRVEDALSKMTIDEKIHILKGSGIGSAIGMDDLSERRPDVVGTIVATPRLGLPSIFLSDGPAGIRIKPTRNDKPKTYYCTAFPIGTSISSSWNTALADKVGKAMGNEALEYGIDVILGPGANIHRHPLCGRNFEYFSEDPVLTGFIGAAVVNGIESYGIGTSPKHFVVNNQETKRFLNDAIISDRALREIYLKGFEIIVKKAQPWTIMSSYNKVNGEYVSESKLLLTDVLRDDWGYNGLVMTDWFGGDDAVSQITAGNDLLEPGTKKQWEALEEGHENGSLTESVINISVKRILKLVIQSKKMQNYKFSNAPDLKANAQIARQAAAEGMVLLKNENTLPLTKSKTIALFGVTSFNFIAGGTGSGDVNEAYTISLEEGLINSGYKISETSKNIFEEHKVNNADQFADQEALEAMFSPLNPPKIKYNTEQIKNIASESDIAIITIGRNSGEGSDRVIKEDFELFASERQMIEEASKIFHEAGKKVIIVLNIGGVIETTSWKNNADAILLAWQGGQEGGNSVADILSGLVNPSGKLPMTFPNLIADHASHANFPIDGEVMSVTDMFDRDEVAQEEKIKNKDYTKYEEGIYVGYRHFDKHDLDISYPFGFGLSYTDFEYSEMELTQENEIITIAITVTNIGNSIGKEVVQLYSSKLNSKIDRPKKELRAFGKTKELAPGAAEVLVFNFPSSELSYWDETISGWNIEKGIYTINAGTSSRDIKCAVEVAL